MIFFLTPDIASKNTLPMPHDDRVQSSTQPCVALRGMLSQLLVWQPSVAKASNRDPKALFPPLLRKPVSPLRSSSSPQAPSRRRRGN